MRHPLIMQLLVSNSLMLQGCAVVCHWYLTVKICSEQLLLFGKGRLTRFSLVRHRPELPHGEAWVTIGDNLLRSNGVWLTIDSAPPMIIFALRRTFGYDTGRTIIWQSRTAAPGWWSRPVYNKALSTYIEHDQSTFAVAGVSWLLIVYQGKYSK